MRYEPHQMLFAGVGPWHVPSTAGTASTPDVQRVLGVNIAAGVAYLAAIEPPSAPALEVSDRLERTAHLEGSAALKDFQDRFGQECRRVRAVAVAVAYPRLHGGWNYADAFVRVSLEAAIMLAAEDLNIRYESMRQEASAKAVGVPLMKAADALPARLGITPNVKWKERSLAVLVGVALARKVFTS